MIESDTRILLLKPVELFRHMERDTRPVLDDLELNVADMRVTLADEGEIRVHQGLGGVSIVVDQFPAYFKPTG